MTNFQEIFSIASGLQEPWSISSISFDKEQSRLDIRLQFTKGHNYVTTMVDLNQRRVLYVTPGKGADCIKKVLNILTQNK